MSLDKALNTLLEMKEEENLESGAELCTVPDVAVSDIYGENGEYRVDYAPDGAVLFDGRPWQWTLPD